MRPMFAARLDAAIASDVITRPATNSDLVLVIYLSSLPVSTTRGKRPNHVRFAGACRLYEEGGAMCRRTDMIPTRAMTDDQRAGGDALLSDESTIELVIKARDGDRGAVQALLQRCLPEVRRWAHGRLPAHARDALDTGDLVQEAALRLLKRVDDFEPRHVGAMQAYLKQSIINRIRDEIRRVGRRPAPVELVEDPPGDAPSPLETTIQHES